MVRSKLPYGALGGGHDLAQHPHPRQQHDGSDQRHQDPRRRRLRRRHVESPEHPSSYQRPEPPGQEIAE
jgi:hypothetical protein